MAKKNNKTNEAEEVISKETSEEETSEGETEYVEQNGEEKALLEKKLEEALTQAAEYKDKWYRTAAEFENYKKRNAETRRNALEEGKTDAVCKILFIGDNVERAIGYCADEKTKEGLEMLLRQYKEILTNLGLTEIDPVGQPFDPNLHEAIFSKDAEEGQESGTVDSVFLKGYKLGEKIIRYAQVVVIK